MMDKKDWKEFRGAGLLFMVNQFLHIFGWAIVFDFEDDRIISVYPARVSFRGFTEESTERGYKNITKYMADNSKDLLKEVNDDN